MINGLVTFYIHPYRLDPCSFHHGRWNLIAQIDAPAFYKRAVPVSQGRPEIQSVRSRIGCRKIIRGIAACPVIGLYLVRPSLIEEGKTIGAAICREIGHQHLHSHSGEDHYGEVKPLIAEPVGDPSFPIGLEITQHLSVICIDLPIAVEVLYPDLSGILSR